MRSSVHEIFGCIILSVRHQRIPRPLLLPDRIVDLLAPLEFVAIREVARLLAILIDGLLVEGDLESLLLVELGVDLPALSLRIAEHLKAVPEQPLFEVFIAFVGHVEHTRKALFLDVKKHCEQDEDFGEIELEGISKAITFDFLNTERVLVEEVQVVLLLLFAEDLLPKLQLHHEVEDQQCLSVEQNKKPVFLARSLLLAHAVPEN